MDLLFLERQVVSKLITFEQFCWQSASFSVLLRYFISSRKWKTILKNEKPLLNYWIWSDLSFQIVDMFFIYQLRNYWKPAPLQEETLLQALPAKSRVEKWDAVFLTINLRQIFKTIITAMVVKPYQLGDLQNLYIAQTLYTKKILRRGRWKHLSDKKTLSHVGRNFGAHLGCSDSNLSSFVSCLQVLQLWTTPVCKALITKRRHSNTEISSNLMRKYIYTRRVHSR